MLKTEQKKAEASGQVIIPAENTPKLAAIPPKYEPRFESDGDRKAFLSESELLKKIPVCRRTLNSWRRRKLIPFIRLPGTRRVLYDFDLVHAALLRMSNSN